MSFWSSVGSFSIPHYGAMVSVCDNSSIRYCATGKISGQFLRRIVNEFKNSSQLAQNISHESNHCYGSEGPNECDGTTVSAVQWTQRYFELTLGWDFEQVWQWDHQNNVPTLRQVGVTAAVPKTTTTEQTPKQDGEKMVDLLALQLKDNLWI